MFKNRLRKYFRYAQMTSFIFETIIEFFSELPMWNYDTEIPKYILTYFS